MLQGLTKKLSLEYLAGIIDGEGCLMIARLRLNKPGESKRGIRFAPVLVIANTYTPLLEMIQVQFGGRIRSDHGKVYSIYFNASEIRNILPKVSPYLVIKKSQSDVLMAFLDKTKAMGSRSISDEVFSFYESCYYKLKDMKRIRFDYDWSPKEIGESICPTCNKEFKIYSNFPRKKFCTRKCLIKDCWTRSNKRIAEGRPAWSSLTN